MTEVADCMRRMLRGSSWPRMFRCGRDGICGVQVNAFKPPDAPSANACARWQALEWLPRRECHRGRQATCCGTSMALRMHRHDCPRQRFAHAAYA
ncbi:hypothetical protein AE921_10900 [Xanthomonas arboricola]|nr:hypothetical protein AKJ12_04850 [Xanthomonas arboricola pv. juglandis]KOA98911.1 hypothetical protein AE920_13865 [Xanthomonas arboricola]PPU15016.1 hypothetical protein XacyCFBP2565_10255 [Xanthomonas arboricola pv. corylina]KOA99978.1 hypothetical protein AE921_10900 [Xanthomonas arboricola]KOB06128.1 hypothetical protein AE923_16810 [Xanthomonas arboricola]